MGLKYCDDHTCYCEPDGTCEKCNNGIPGFIRPRYQVNPHDKKRIADLEKRGLIESK